MIIAEQKSLAEIKSQLGEAEKVLVLGCGTCVTVCFAGGEREAAIMASSLRMATKLSGNGKQVEHATVQRQCEWEYLDQVAEQVKEADVILSLGCGIGVQAIAEHFPEKWVVPGLNTTIQVLIPSQEGPNFAMRKFSMKPGGGMPLHTNTVEHEQYVLGGRARIGIGEQVYEVQPGDVVFIPEGIPHFYENIGDEPFEFLCVIPNKEDVITIVEEFSC